MAGFRILDDNEPPQQPRGFRILDDEPVDKPKPMGMGANADFLKQELANADWGTRNIAGFGTALSDLYEGAKQMFGQGDLQRIKDNKVIAQAAPVGAIAGNVAMTAIPFGLAGNGVNAAAKVGTVMGALNPIDSDNAKDIVGGKIIGAATGGALSAAGQGVANAGAKFFQKRAADEALRQSVNAPIDQTLRDALDAGLVATPSSVNPSWFNAIREGTGGKAAVAQDASVRNATTVDALSRRAVGLPEDTPLTSEAMQAVRDKAYQSGYAPLEKAGQLNVSPEYTQALDAITANRSSAARSFPGAASPDLKAIVEGYKPPSGAFDVGDALKAAQVLRKDATAAFRKGDNEVGSAKRAISDEIENEIERQLVASGQSNGPDLVQKFRDARKLMAKSHDVEDAIIEGGGTVDARKFGAMLQRGAPLTDELRTIGAFANNFPKAVQPVSRVAGPGVSKLDIAMALASGMSGAATTGSPEGGFAALAPIIASKAARAQMFSKGSQNALKRVYGLSAPEIAANRLLQYAPVGGAVLGSNALAKYLSP